MSDAAPLALPPLDPLKTAFVYLHAQSGGDFFADVPFAWTAGEMRALGLEAELFHVWLERGRPDVDARRLDALVAALARGRYRLVVFEHLWRPELLRRLQEQLGALVCVTGAFAGGEGARVDFAISHFESHRQPLIDLAVALRGGGDLLAVPNLRVHLRHMPAPRSSAAPPEPHPARPDALRPFCPVVDARHIGVQMDAQGEAPPVRKSLDTNKGCPYAADIADNPAFAGVPFGGEDVRLRGCAFCPMGGDYRALPWRQTVQLHLDQIAWYQRHLPALDEIVLRDQHALRYLPALVQGALDRGLRPFGLLVPGRGDAILRFGEQMRRTAALSEGTGMWFCIYLVGFESFSQAQLDLYNKGVTVAQYAEALRQMRALHATHPETFRLYAHAASSFILFNPWTRLEDLEQTAAFCDAHAVGALSHGLLRSRLRLYPELPLYWKARAEGLLVEGGGEAGRGAAFSGYGVEARWRFVDGRIAALEALLGALQPHVRTAEEVGLLRAGLRHARATMPEALPGAEAADVDRLRSIAAIERGVRRLRALWREAEARAGPERGARAGDGPAGAPGEGGEAEARRRRHAPVRARAGRLVPLGARCNNRCRTCLAGHAVHDTEPARLRAAVVGAAAGGEIVLAGREPTLLPGLPALLRAAVRAGARRVELVSNGRALAIPGVAGRLGRAGLTHLLLKRHRLRDEDEDAFTRTPGAGAQLWAALERLRQEAPRVVVSLLLVATADGHGELPALVALGAERGVRRVQLRVPAGELDLGALPAMTGSLREALAEARRLDMRCGIDGF